MLVPRALLAVLILAAAPPVTARGGLLPDSLLAAGLEAAGLGAAELSCFPERNEPDPFRLPLVTAIMAQPAAADSLLAGLLAELFAPPAAVDPLGAPDLGLLAGLAAALHPELAGRTRGGWEAARLQLLEAMGDDPPTPVDYFAALLPELARQREAALAGLSAAERALLLRESPRLLDEQRETEQIRDPLTLRRLEAAAQARSDSLLALWARVDRSRLAALSLRYLRDSLWATRILIAERYGAPATAAAAAPDEAPARHRFPDGSLAEGELLYAATGPQGNCVVGGRGANRYEGNFIYILDLGGDDEYRLDSCWPADAAALAAGAGFRCLVDLAGDDRWQAKADGALAGAFLGAALLVDEAGDDDYRAQDFDLGCGWLGAGLLVDRAGDDLYTGGSAVMGAGGGGLGLLVDEAGADCYRAELYAQGFGWVGGAGVLRDRAGGDLYATSPAYTDILRYEDHALSLAQGFAIGARPGASGGLGILRDEGGSDHYLADIYGQGAAYWYGLGLLQDLGGNDSYTAYQYAQGAGIHFALGFLLDAAGNDAYTSHGVGQGCGHDLGLGILADTAGNDRYACDDLSLGAGSANGIGILLDGAGQDGYLAKSSTAPAYGNPRSHWGSVGLLVDGEGADWYSAPGGPGDRQGSLTGTLLDLPQRAASPVWDPGPAVAYVDSAWSLGDYFLMAASGEPRFRDWQRAGLDSLIAAGPAAVTALIPRFATPVARERHTLKDVCKGVGIAAVAPLREVLREGPPATWRQAAWCLEEIGDAAAFPELIALLAEPRDARDETAALAALARLRGLSPVERRVLAATCRRLAARDDCHPLVLKEIAYLLGEQELGERDLLLALAAADHYAPRWAAQQALGRQPGWGPAFARNWRRALAAGDAVGATRLAALLPQRSARECAQRLREAERSGLLAGAAPGLERALLRALREHPRADSPLLGASGRRLAARHPDLTAFSLRALE